MTENDDVRSAEGHAAMSILGDRWIKIQENTFTNWVNQQLIGADHNVEDLQEDFSDGIKLCALVEALQNRRIKRVVKKPINQHQYLENVTLALKAISEDDVKLVNIGNSDIVNGNRKLVMGLIWHLILRYQIGKTTQLKIPPKKLMLAWLNAAIPDIKITNFTSNWNDGIALHALLEYCQPGLCPGWRTLNPHDRVANCTDAMQLAEKHFDIPQVVRPEDLASRDLDELSGMTYLSYFMKVDSPGYYATLNYVRDQLRSEGKTVNNFQTDWNDGKVLCSLVNSLGGHIYDVSNTDWPGNCAKGMQQAEEMGVAPVISPEEMADPDTDHLGIMAYAAYFQNIHPNKLVPNGNTATETHANKVKLDADLKTVTVGSSKTFHVDLLDSQVQESDLRVELQGPTSQPPVSLFFNGDRGEAVFVPSESGTHQLTVFCKGEVVQGCPVKFLSVADKSKVLLMSSFDTCNVGCSTEIKVSAPNSIDGAVQVEAISPRGQSQNMSVTQEDGKFMSNFVPTEIGEWTIKILYEGEHISGSPFHVRVYDSGLVKVYGLEGGSVGEPFSFTADTSSAGDGELAVKVLRDGHLVAAQVLEDGAGVNKVNFTPDGPGVYMIHVYFGGKEIS
ncbi:unnamed protein product, partial [Owenia fusiformis]